MATVVDLVEGRSALPFVHIATRLCLRHDRTDSENQRTKTMESVGNLSKKAGDAEVTFILADKDALTAERSGHYGKDLWVYSGTSPRLRRWKKRENESHSRRIGRCIRYIGYTWLRAFSMREGSVELPSTHK